MRFDRQARLALIVASLTLAASGLGFRYAVHAANAYLEKEPVDLRRPLTNVPKRLGSWQATGEDLKLTAELEEALGTHRYLDRTYVRDDDGGRREHLGIHVVYYTGLIDAVPHVPDRCMVAGGWVNLGLPSNLDLPLDRSEWVPEAERVNLRSGEPYPILTFRHHVTGQPITVRMPIGDYKIRTSEFRSGDQPDLRIYAGYFFIANGQITPWPEKVRSFAFDLKSRHAYYAKVQFTMYASDDFGKDEFTEVVSDLLAEFLPELMWCLPDWAEVESESSAPTS